MLAHDLADRRETQAVAGGAGREERLEDAVERRLGHAASGIADRNAQIAAGCDPPMGQRSRGRDLVYFSLDFDPPGSVHRLGGIVAEIDDDLLQLGMLAGDRGRLRCIADDELDRRWKRGEKQGGRFGYQGLYADGPPTYVAMSTIGENLVDKIARPLSGPTTGTVGRAHV